MKTDDLIQKLSVELKATKPMASPLKTTVLFVFIAFLLIGLGFVMLSARIDLQEQVAKTGFLTELCLSFLLALSALALAVFLSRPGRALLVAHLKKMTTGLFVLFVFYGGLHLLPLDHDQIHFGLSLSGMKCSVSVLVYSLLLGAFVFYSLQKGASLKPHLSGVAVGVAAIAFGNVAISFFCEIDNPVHILTWHFALPILIAIASGALIAGRFLKW